MNKPARQVDPRTPSDMLVNGGALTLALNVLRRAGKDEVAEELEKTAVSACSAPVSAMASKWHEGEPPFPQNQEWFIAEMTNKDRVVLMALSKEHSYDYQTADGTYLKAGTVKRWMQFPDCEYLPPKNVDTPLLVTPVASTSAQVVAAPPCWWINHESHGQITQCHKEAARAAADGKTVIEYAPNPMVAYQQNNNCLPPTDDEIIDMAVEPLGIDCDRMPYGVVVFARALLSRYAVMVKYPTLDTDLTTLAEWFECEGQVFHKDSPDMNDWIRWKGTPLYRHPAHAQVLRKKNKDLWDALIIARNTITDARNDLIACHSIKGVIPADDVEGLAGVVEYDSILKLINAALSESVSSYAAWCVSSARSHPDDEAVDRFATAMKAKLAKKRGEGRGGWQDKKQCSQQFLSDLLREHVEKGNPVDVGNLAMMLHQRGEAIAAQAQPDIRFLLKDPVVVHNNMCRGIIAPITFDMLAHVLGDDAKQEWLTAQAQQPVSGEQPCLLDALSAIEWLERRVPQSYKNSEGEVACVVKAKEFLRRLIATPQAAGNAAQAPSVSTLSAETLRLCGVIADKIEDGTLFQAGIYQNSELAAFVRQLNRSASAAQAHKDINEKMTAWRSDDVDLHAALAIEFSKHPQTKTLVGREALVLRCLRAAIEAA